MKAHATNLTVFLASMTLVPVTVDVRMGPAFVLGDAAGAAPEAARLPDAGDAGVVVTCRMSRAAAGGGGQGACGA